MQLSYNSVVVLLGIYAREMKTYSHKNLYLNVYSSFSHNSKKLERIKHPSPDECFKWYIHTVENYR